MQGCKTGSKFPTFTNNTLRAYPLITKMLQSGLEMCRIVALTGVSSTTIQKIKAYNDGHGVVSQFSPQRFRYGCADIGGLNPVDGFWCSNCYFSGVVRFFDLDTETMEPDWDLPGDCVPRFCPNCGKEIDWNGADTPVSEVCYE